MKQILIVNDDETFRYILAKLLRKEFEVLESSGVKDALTKLKMNAVDLICSDYNMWDGTGLRFAAILQGNEDFCSIHTHVR